MPLSNEELKISPVRAGECGIMDKISWSDEDLIDTIKMLDLVIPFLQNADGGKSLLYFLRAKRERFLDFVQSRLANSKNANTLKAVYYRDR